MASRRLLLKVFQEVERLIKLPDNNFDWAGWEDAADALEEIKISHDRIKQNQFPIYADILFLPTGPLQETSLSSGWGDEFCAVADEYDAAMAAPEDCACYTDPLGLLGQETALGMDQRFGEISILSCSKCAQPWVRYLIEEEAFSGSGRWYLGAVDGEVFVESAKTLLEESLEYWCGGSYFEGQVRLTNGPIH